MIPDDVAMITRRPVDLSILFFATLLALQGLDYIQNCRSLIIL